MDDLATWINALVAGRVLDPTYQRRWFDSLKVPPHRAVAYLYLVRC